MGCTPPLDEAARDLRRIRIFADLPDEALAHIACVAVRRVIARGATIIVEGDPCQAAYFVAEGYVRVYRLSPSGREQVLARLSTGQAFNTVPPFQHQGVNHATVEALTAATLYAILSRDFRSLVSEWPALALAILKDFAARLDHLTNLVEDLSLRSVRGRLARFLLEHAPAGPSGTSDASGVTQRWTQDEIAAHLGTVRDVVGRTLRSFGDAGLVQMDRQRIVLLDREGLEAEAQR